MRFITDDGREFTSYEKATSYEEMLLKKKKEETEKREKMFAEVYEAIIEYKKCKENLYVLLDEYISKYGECEVDVEW